jgi:hypothetical protein
MDYVMYYENYDSSKNHAKLSTQGLLLGLGMSPKVPCIKSLVPIPWCYWVVAEYLVGGA